MPGSLANSPAQIVARVLADLGLGVVGGTSGSWPIHVGTDPDSPDNVLVLFDTAARMSGRIMLDGEKQDYHGIQVRVRSSTYPVGYAKSREVAVALDGVAQKTLSFDGNSYKVWSFSRTGDVMGLGFESPTSRRLMFTVNGVVSLRQMS